MSALGGKLSLHRGGDFGRFAPIDDAALLRLLRAHAGHSVELADASKADIHLGAKMKQTV